MFVIRVLILVPRINHANLAISGIEAVTADANAKNVTAVYSAPILKRREPRVRYSSVYPE